MLLAMSAFKAAFCELPGWFEISSLEGLKRTAGIHYARFNYLPEVSIDELFPKFLAIDKKMYFSGHETRTQQIPNLSKWSSFDLKLTVPLVSKSILENTNVLHSLPKFMTFSSLSQITLKYRSKQYCFHHGLTTTVSLGKEYMKFLQDLKGITPVVPRGRLMQCSNQHDVDFFMDPSKAFDPVRKEDLLSFSTGRKVGAFWKGKENSMRLFFTRLFKAKDIAFISDMMEQVYDFGKIARVENAQVYSFHPLADFLVKQFVGDDSRFIMNYGKQNVKGQWRKAPNLLNSALCYGLDNEVAIDLMMKLIEQGCNPKQRVKAPAVNTANDVTMKEEVSNVLIIVNESVTQHCSYRQSCKRFQS